MRQTRMRWGVFAIKLAGILGGACLVGCGNAAKPIDSSGPPSSPPAETVMQPGDAVNDLAETLPEVSLVADDLPTITDILNDVEKTGFEQEQDLADLRTERDKTVWKKEQEAQEYEQALVAFWDQLLKAQREKTDILQALEKQTFQSIVWGSAMAPESLPLQCYVRLFDDSARARSTEDWLNLLGWARNQGFQIEQTEWHHSRFEKDSRDVATSTITMAIYATKAGRGAEGESRHVLSGDLVVEWWPKKERDLPKPKRIDATGLKWYSRDGAVAFKEILTVDHASPENKSGVQPIHVSDLDGDGLSEIVLTGSNEVFWNRGNNEFQPETLFRYPEKGFEVGLLADVTRDGIVDYVSPGRAGDLLLYEGVANEDDAKVRFNTRPKGKARGGGPLRQPQVIAAGDVDQDGDVDLWIGQYKISYVGGQMPTPYYDANDGFPAYFLFNEGGGKFVPATEEVGLAAKRFRRSYGGSFVDLDQDADLDLIVVSDFAGVDVYRNDEGYFHDVTDMLLDERHLFGMAVTFADYNLDGALDFFVTGMASTTARRLDFMKLGRRDRPDVHLMRSRMGYGNRMYLNSPAMTNNANQTPTFRQPDFKDTVARTGWTWGATSLDVQNDGFPDVFVANGHSSGKSTKDHCSHFWCHDIYDATSQPNSEISKLFGNVMQGYVDRTESWDGYQKNQLLVNDRGNGFVNLGYLLGVGHEYDGRAVLGDDLDGDGRRDLIVVEDRWQDGQILHVYRNQLETEYHWIGIRLLDKPGKYSPLGASVVLHMGKDKQVVQCVTAGDSIHAQHAPTVHFGLGEDSEVKRIDVRLVGGEIISMTSPKIDRYHEVEIK